MLICNCNVMAYAYLLVYLLISLRGEVISMSISMDTSTSLMQDPRNFTHFQDTTFAMWSKLPIRNARSMLKYALLHGINVHDRHNGTTA